MAPAVAAVGSRSPKRVSAPAAVGARPSARPNGSTGNRPLTIGDVSRRSGFSVKTLRFYEGRELLLPSGRSAGGFRLYTEADLGRLEFIRGAKALGLALNEIRELVAATRERSCRMTRPLLLRLLGQRIAQTSEQIETLRRLRQRLQRRRRKLVRRPPPDHRRGYCACFGEGQALIPLSALSGKARGTGGQAATPKLTHYPEDAHFFAKDRVNRRSTTSSSRPCGVRRVPAWRPGPGLGSRILKPAAFSSSRRYPPALR